MCAACGVYPRKFGYNNERPSPYDSVGSARAWPRLATCDLRPATCDLRRCTSPYRPQLQAANCKLQTADCKLQTPAT